MITISVLSVTAVAIVVVTIIIVTITTMMMVRRRRRIQYDGDECSKHLISG